MNITTTSDLEDFGSRERNILIELLTAWSNQGLPPEFAEKNIKPVFNQKTGGVFLANYVVNLGWNTETIQLIAMNGKWLEIWNHCSSCGHEGFESACQLNEAGCNECTHWAGTGPCL